MASKILIVDDEKSIRITFQAILEMAGYSVDTAKDYDTAIELITKKDFDVMFVDILLGEKTGIDILKKVKDRNIYCPVIMITGKPEIETSIKAVRQGAYDYLPKPIRKDTLLRVAEQALRHRELWDEKNQIKAEKERYRRNLEAIFKSLQDAIVTVDLDMRVIEANESTHEICSFMSTDIIGREYTAIKGKCKKLCEKVFRETLQTKDRVSEYRIECMHEDRPRQVVELTSSPLTNEEDNFIGAVLVIRDISRLTDLERELRERHQFQHIIGKSPKMIEIYRLLEDLADTETTVLITGESGTGKELVARALHYSGIRAFKPMVSVNCSALSENLLESELFGHVKGAFTGAIKDKAGRFETADGGTIFLDEIGEISPRIQLKLLRILQERVFERVGESSPTEVDVRVIAATNKDLMEEVRLGQFREDLYYRLKVINLELPPLRKRLDDIPLFVDHFCNVFNNRFGKKIQGVSDNVLSLLMRYSWPGNIRELEHAIEHAFVLCRGNTITIDNLPKEIKDQAGAKETVPGRSPDDEKTDIQKALERSGWNKAKAARLLGVSRQTIYRKIEDYNISLPKE